jgi:hypothetical protein
MPFELVWAICARCGDVFLTAAPAEFVSDLAADLRCDCCEEEENDPSHDAEFLELADEDEWK